MKNRFPALCATVACLLALAACGGGGGGSGGGGSSGNPTPVASTNAFPLQAGFQKRITTGASDKFTVEDYCDGTSVITYSTPVPEAPGFEGVASYSVTQTATATYSNCVPSTITNSVTNHYDSNYTLIGTTSTGGQYVRFVPPAPAALPASVKVGDTGTMVTMNMYASSLQTILTGKRVLSYEIEPDTASTAILDLITQDFDTNGNVKITEHSLYRMAADGTLTLLYIDVQDDTHADPRHYLYTRVP